MTIVCEAHEKFPPSYLKCHKKALWRRNLINLVVIILDLSLVKTQLFVFMHVHVYIVYIVEAENLGGEGGLQPPKPLPPVSTPMHLAKLVSSSYL